MVNKSADVFRFEWPEAGVGKMNAAMSIKPLAGHILPNSTKQIEIKFNSDKADPLEEKIPVSLTKIKLIDEHKMEEWDNSMQEVKMVSKAELERLKKEEEEAKDPKKKAPATKDKGKAEEVAVDDGEKTEQITMVVPEPENSKVEGSMKTNELKVQARCD